MARKSRRSRAAQKARNRDTHADRLERWKRKQDPSRKAKQLKALLDADKPSKPQRKLVAARLDGYSDSLPERIAAADANLSREANESARLQWLNEHKPRDTRPTPEWSADDLGQLDLPHETLDALRQAGITSCALLARCEALGQIPSHLDQPAIAAALTTWVDSSERLTPSEALAGRTGDGCVSPAWATA